MISQITILNIIKFKFFNFESKSIIKTVLPRSNIFHHPLRGIIKCGKLLYNFIISYICISL